jgi:hypothetical protein
MAATAPLRRACWPRRHGRHADRVRVEVEDEGGPWRPGGGQNGQSGRGLAIVGQLASRWGRDDCGDPRTVWFEIEW